ncbi:uncharacterized protein LOC135836423 [Planococcus citri]|uniref:uncharacterized protein LOC135836423 n=1 Tax=Planococcus citri TaxID=170843 RepID=UPI0031F94FF2
MNKLWILLAGLAIFRNTHQSDIVKLPAKKPPIYKYTSNFEEVTRCSGFVDKTLMIETFFIKLHGNFHLITAPRKYGKTTMLDMFERFVQIEVDQNGNVINKTSTSNYELFTSSNLKIGRKSEIISEHMAEYPVIYINFNSIVGRTFRESMQAVRGKVKACYDRYRWLYELLVKKYTSPEHNRGSVSQKEDIKFMEKVYREDLNYVEIKYSLHRLAKIVYEYFKKKIFVIVDDYDATVFDSIKDTSVFFDVKEISKLINEILYELFRTSKFNEVAYALLTGATAAMAPSNNFKILNLYNHPFLDEVEFGPFFGFTQDEVTPLLYLHNIKPSDWEDVENFCGGYVIRNTPIRMYNPYSVLLYLSHHGKDPKLQKAWIDLMPLDFLLDFLQVPAIYELYIQLVMLKNLQFELVYYSLEDLEQLSTGIRERRVSRSFDFRIFYTFLFENGYLSYTDQTDSFSVPNGEVYDAITGSLFQFYDYKIKVDRTLVGDVLKDMFEKETVDDLIAVDLKIGFDRIMYGLKHYVPSNVLDDFYYHSIVFYVARAGDPEAHVEERVEGQYKPRTTISPVVDIIMSSEEKEKTMVIDVSNVLNPEQLLNQAMEFKPFEAEEHFEMRYLAVSLQNGTTSVAFSMPTNSENSETSRLYGHVLLQKRVSGGRLYLNTFTAP